jgi:hypothetical protein
MNLPRDAPGSRPAADALEATLGALAQANSRRTGREWPLPELRPLQNSTPLLGIRTACHVFVVILFYQS